MSQSVSSATQAQQQPERKKLLSHALAQKIAGHDLVKAAQAVEELDLTGLPAQAFADPIGRKIPVHTKDAALSACVASLEIEDEEVKLAVKRAAVSWGIEDVYDQIQSVTVKSAECVKYACEFEHEGQQYRYFAYKNAEELSDRASNFFSSRYCLPFAAREAAAQTFKKAQAELGAEFTEEQDQYFAKLAANAVVDSEALANALIQRRARLSGPSDNFAKLAQIVQHVMEHGDEGKVAAQAFSEYDVEEGVCFDYGKGVDLPEEALYTSGTTMKIAGESVTLSNGKTIQISDISWDKVAAFDPDLVEAVGANGENAADILPTWPRPDADTLVDTLGL